ncbi:MAG: translation initiation factor IF-2, partial [Anaerolineaceae bacterium]
MAKMKVFEVKNLINDQYHGNIESKDIQNFLEMRMGIKKTHSSNLEDHEVKAVKEHFVPSAKKTSETPATKKVRSASHNSEMGKELTDGKKPAVAAKQSRQTVTRPDGSGQAQRTQRPPQGDAQGYQSRPDGLGQTRPGGMRPEGMTRPDGSGQATGGQRPPQGVTQSYHAQGMTRPHGSGQGRSQGMARPDQTGQTRPQRMRPDGQRGQQGMRPNQTGQTRPGGMRPDGQRGPQGMRQDGTGQTRPQGMRQDGTGQTRPQGMRQDGQNTSRYDGMTRPDGSSQGQGQRGQQGARPDGSSQAPRGQAPRGPRPPQGGQQGYQSQGMTRSDGMTRPQGNRPYNTGGASRQMQPGGGQGYNQQARGQRPPQGVGQGYQSQGTTRSDGTGQRTQGRYDGTGQTRQQGQPGRTYQARDQRPTDQGATRQGSYQDNRRTSDQGRYRSDGQQQGARPDGMRPDRSGQGQGRPSGGRPYNNQGNYQRPQGGQGSGQRGGYNTRGFETFNKDEDDKPANGNRSHPRRGGSQSQRGNSQRGSERKNFDQQILDQKVAEKNDNRRNRDRMNKDKQYKDKNVAQRDNDESISKIIPKKGQFIKPKPVVVEKEEIKVITLPEILTIKELADKMKIPGAVLIKKLFLAGQVVTINQEITYEEAEEIALEYDIISEKEVLVNEVEELLKEEDEDPADMVKRPPVVCVMGHVDHGKTSLLDAIRHANVTSREAGGITQHIGAYIVEIKGEKITFLDTPGHEAFTSMRMRGAQATDIAILVVAADDGVMPQTVEAISHAKAAGVKIIVAINKIDKPSANVERVKQELTEHELIAEDWGGDTIFVPVSAHTKEGIEHLLEMILLTAEMEELKANPNRTARGLVIEAELDKGRGPVATILVQKGTLRVGDNIVVGSSYGKVRAMIDDKGRRADEAGPSTPVEILGLNSVPDVGEIFMSTESEKEARTISEAFITQGKEKLISDTKAKLSLDGLFSQIQAGNIKELNLIIKADVQGSVEAMKQSLLKLSNDEVAVRVIHGGVG